ncbi:hypothetical protein [Psychroflexus planctonicus]|nr:hypothetical protein [Psychroflexus planctonicus]
MKKFRKPYFAALMSTLILFVSCEDYLDDSTNETFKFNNEVYIASYNSDLLNKVTINMNVNNKNIDDTYERNKAILSSINIELGTNIELPDEYLKLSLEIGADSIYSVALSNNWLKQSTVDLTEDFSSNIFNYGFNDALNIYKDKVLELNLTSEEFEKHNLFVNIVTSLNDKSPFVAADPNSSFGSGYRCALATLALAITTANMLSCATIIACGVAMLLQVNAMYAFNDHCLKD